MIDLRECCQAYLTDNGDGPRTFVARLLAETSDRDLAKGMINVWFYVEGPPTIKQAAAMFADLRDDLHWLDEWRLEDDVENFKSTRQALGLSTQNLARLFQISDGRTVRRWEAGTRSIPGPARVLMFLLQRSVITPDDLRYTAEPFSIIPAMRKPPPRQDC